MDWQQKAAALEALAPISIKFRRPGNWYVDQQVEVKDGGILRGEYGNGCDPEEAINDHWDKLTTIQSPLYLVARSFFNGNVETRMAARWNGFMWETINEPQRVAS